MYDKTAEIAIVRLIMQADPKASSRELGKHLIENGVTIDVPRDLLARWQMLDEDVFCLMQKIRQRIADLEKAESLESREARNVYSLRENVSSSARQSKA